MNSAADIITDLVFLVMAFGLEVIAILMLVWSAIFARSMALIITLGIVAAVLMFVESFLWLAGIVIGSSGGSLTGDNPGFRYLAILTVISVVCLLIYFPIAILRWKARSRTISDMQKPVAL
jgi:ethanolamine transporter EutH